MKLAEGWTCIKRIRWSEYQAMSDSDKHSFIQSLLTQLALWRNWRDAGDLKSLGGKLRVGSSPTLATTNSECSAVWSACLIWIQEVVGSNPTTPTNMHP